MISCFNLYFRFFSLLADMSKFVCFVFPFLIMNQVHKLSGKILTGLDSFHTIKNDWATKKAANKRATIVALIINVTGCLCFPLILATKCVHVCLLALTKKVNSLSGNTLYYLQSNQTEEEDVTKSQGDGWHPNLYFYLNIIPFQPSGEYIDEIMLKWYGNNELLFTNEWYIQWLFPNKEVPSNQYASPLTDYEVQKIMNDPEASKRVRTAFEMMLNFFGMELTQNNQFKDSLFCHGRWKVLNNNPFLAEYITRILKTFRDLKNQQLNSLWLDYLFDLIFVRKELCNLESSFINSWVDVLPDRERRIMLSECQRMPH